MGDLASVTAGVIVETHLWSTAFSRVEAQRLCACVTQAEALGLRHQAGTWLDALIEHRRRDAERSPTHRAEDRAAVRSC
jgi:hypothetical protein